jgi:hypothetical protein
LLTGRITRRSGACKEPFHLRFRDPKHPGDLTGGKTFLGEFLDRLLPVGRSPFLKPGRNPNRSTHLASDPLLGGVKQEPIDLVPEHRQTSEVDAMDLLVANRPAAME